METLRGYTAPVNPIRCVSASSKPVGYTYRPVLPGIGEIEISRGTRTNTYTVRESMADPEAAPGRHFRLVKISDGSGKLLDCHIANDPRHSTCDCESAIYANGLFPCKHVVALTQALASGEIDKIDPEYPAEECWYAEVESNRCSCNERVKSSTEEAMP